MARGSVESDAEHGGLGIAFHAVLVGVAASAVLSSSRRSLSPPSLAYTMYLSSHSYTSLHCPSDGDPWPWSHTAEPLRTCTDVNPPWTNALHTAVASRLWCFRSASDPSRQSLCLPVICRGGCPSTTSPSPRSDPTPPLTHRHHHHHHPLSFHHHCGQQLTTSQVVPCLSEPVLHPRSPRPSMGVRGGRSSVALSDAQLKSAHHSPSSSSSMTSRPISSSSSSSSSFSSSPSSSPSFFRVSRFPRLSLLPLLLCLCVVLTTVCVPSASAGSALYFDDPDGVVNAINTNLRTTDGEVPPGKFTPVTPRPPHIATPSPAQAVASALHSNAAHLTDHYCALCAMVWCCVLVCGRV